MLLFYKCLLIFLVYISITFYFKGVSINICEEIFQTTFSMLGGSYLITKLFSVHINNTIMEFVNNIFPTNKFQFDCEKKLLDRIKNSHFHLSEEAQQTLYNSIMNKTREFKDKDSAKYKDVLDSWFKQKEHKKLMKTKVEYEEFIEENAIFFEKNIVEQIYQKIYCSSHELSSSKNVFCLKGPPGIGKTTLIHSIAKHFDIEITHFDEGKKHVYDLTYSWYNDSEIPDILLCNLEKTKYKNGFLIFDDVKLNQRNKKTLASIFDGSLNTYYSSFLHSDVDVSGLTIFILTNDVIDDVAIQNRLHTFELNELTEENKKLIVEKYINKYFINYDDEKKQSIMEKCLEQDKKENDKGIRTCLKTLKVYKTEKEFFDLINL